MAIATEAELDARLAEWEVSMDISERAIVQRASDGRYIEVTPCVHLLWAQEGDARWEQLRDRLMDHEPIESLQARSARCRAHALGGGRKFRKKPVVIEALRWDGSAAGAPPIINWILTGDFAAVYDDFKSPVIRINTLEGAIAASPGDWIIKGVQGEFYPCKPDIFAATYEAVSE